MPHPDHSKHLKMTAVLYAILAAVFYALNAPVSKLLLASVPATFMASFLYLGAGTGVGILYLFQFRKENKSERLTRSDLPYTIGMIVLDVAAPIFMMLGIQLGTASGAALLGNFEIVATTLIALFIFREAVSAKLWIAIGLITVSGMLLSFESGGTFDVSVGSLLVLAATVCWGLENNCTRKISDKSTYEIVTLKGICSGLGAFVIAVCTGEALPALPYVIGAMVLGFIAYGLSIFTYIRAQRDLGAAKTSAFYAIAPFIGVLFAFLLVGEKPGRIYFVSLAIMAAGTALAVWDTVSKGQ